MATLVENKTLKNAERTTKIKLVPSMACPVCMNMIPLPRILPTQELNRYDIKLRSFFNWCFNCGQGVQKNEFLHDGVWVLYRWRHFMYDAKDKLIIKEWVIENELPVPIVIVGPSSDYDKSYLTKHLFNIFTNHACGVAKSHKKRLCNLSARILHIQQLFGFDVL